MCSLFVFTDSGGPSLGFHPQRGTKYPVTPGIPTTRKAERETLRYAALSEQRHRLRAPLNHVLGYTETLIEDASEARNAIALEALRQIHSTARGALSDINVALANRDSVEAQEVQA